MSKSANREQFAKSENIGDYKPPPVNSPFSISGFPEAEEHVTDHHVDFLINTRDVEALSSQTFTWSDHAFPVISRFAPAMADYIDEEFRTISDLTYEFMGSERGVDTSRFRFAVWNYVLRLKGVVNEDYQYFQVNQVLTPPLKFYCKAVSCFPYTITLAMHQHFMDLEESEKVHVTLLAMEARKQAGYLHGLNAIMAFLGADS